MRNLVTLAFVMLTFGAIAQVADGEMATQELEEVVVSSKVIDVAKERLTPIAVSTIKASEISLKVGNMEFPEIMNNTPGVYATKQGGGYGDSRISLRGFDQRNTSFLINGQPVNDMENGWVYWSNWQGLTDVASGIQIQRGLGASRLAVPSVGGTVSIFTKTADLYEGGSISQMVGNDGFFKTTALYNTGKNDKGWASSFLLSKWQGNGYVNFTGGAGWTYFGAVGYAPEGSDHAFNLSILGAGQWHHQRSAWVSIRDYQNFGEEGIDRRWNTNGGFLNGEEYNMRRNFYNKPLATLNWDWKIQDNLELNTSLYGSAGRGGGTGPRGRNYFNSDIDLYPFNKDLTEHYLENGRGSRDENGYIDFDAVVAHNTDKVVGSHNDRDYARDILIRRASMNSHDWVGAISNLTHTDGTMKYSVGIDLRKYKGYHYRVLNDLLGLEGYVSTGNRNLDDSVTLTAADQVVAKPFRNTGLDGNKINYFNVGNVGWRGINGMVEHNGVDLTAVVQGGISRQSYQREDYFANTDNPNSDKVGVTGGYLKSGVNYNIDEKSNVFANGGFISRQPLFDAVFPNFGNDVNPNLQNEVIKSLELGYGYNDGKLKLDVNLYNTVWDNRFVTRGFRAGGDDFTVQFDDVDVRHKGIEFEGSYKYSPMTSFKGMLSIGDWRYTKDFEGSVFDENNDLVDTETLYLNDVKVGDAAQFTAMLGVDQRIGSKVKADLNYRFVDNLFADYSIIDSEFRSEDNRGAVKLPSFGLVDLGASYYITPDLSFRANINNVFNTTYIAESNTNIHAESGDDTWKGINTLNSVWFGFGTTWNASLKYKF